MLKQIFKESKQSVALPYTLLFMEFTATSTIPWLLGKSIDNLLQNNYSFFLIYIACLLLGLLIGTLRRNIDTKVFTNIWKKLTLNSLRSQTEKNIPTPKIIARIKNIERFTNFYENMIPYTVKCIVHSTISFTVLFNTVGPLSFIILLTMLLSLLASQHFSQKIETTAKQLQQTDEQINSSIFSKELSNIEEVYQQKYNLIVKTSNLEAFNWATIDTASVICEVLAIFMLIKCSSTTGQITAALIYVNSLCGNFSCYSSLFIQLKELKVAKQTLENEQ